MGEGRERGRWGGAYVERLGGPEGAGWGWGWDCGASSEGEGREGGRGGRPRSGRAGGRRSAVSTALPPLAATRVPAARPRGSPGALWRVRAQPPAPSAGRGRGEGKSPAWGGRGEEEGVDGTDQTPRNRTCSGVSPCSSEPQQWLRQRWGSRERGRGRPLKRQPLRQAQGAAEDKGQGRDCSPLGLLGQLGGRPWAPRWA